MCTATVTYPSNFQDIPLFERPLIGELKHWQVFAKWCHNLCSGNASTVKDIEGVTEMEKEVDEICKRQSNVPIQI